MLSHPSALAPGVANEADLIIAQELEYAYVPPPVRITVPDADPSAAEAQATAPHTAKAQARALLQVAQRPAGSVVERADAGAGSVAPHSDGTSTSETDNRGSDIPNTVVSSLSESSRQTPVSARAASGTTAPASGGGDGWTPPANAVIGARECRRTTANSPYSRMCTDRDEVCVTREWLQQTLDVVCGGTCLVCAEREPHRSCRWRHRSRRAPNLCLSTLPVVGLHASQYCYSQHKSSGRTWPR